MPGIEYGPKPEGWTRFVCVSDTHGLHNKMTTAVPDGDVFIHAGDFTNTGELSQVQSLSAFLGTLPHEHKIVIAGNHGTFARAQANTRVCVGRRDLDALKPVYTCGA